MRKCAKNNIPVFRQALALVIVAALAALVSAFFPPGIFAPPALAPDETTWAQVAGWQRRQAQSPQDAGATHILILDARPDDAYRAAHVPGALPLNEPRWEQHLPAVIESLRDNTRVVIYCDDSLCEASRGVATRLRRELALGETDVFIVKDGWREWQQTHASPPATESPATNPSATPSAAGQSSAANQPSAQLPSTGPHAASTPSINPPPDSLPFINPSTANPSPANPPAEPAPPDESAPSAEPSPSR